MNVIGLNQKARLQNGEYDSRRPGMPQCKGAKVSSVLTENSWLTAKGDLVQIVDYGTMRTDDFEDTTLRTQLWGQTTLRTDDFEDMQLWGQNYLGNVINIKTDKICKIVKYCQKYWIYDDNTWGMNAFYFFIYAANIWRKYVILRVSVWHSS